MATNKTSVVTPEFRVSYPNVFEAKMNDLSGKMEFSVQALFKKAADLKKLKAAAHAACVENWGADPSKWPALSNNPFRDQSERAKDGKLPDGHEPGAVFMNFKSSDKPGIVDQNTDPIMDKTKFYGGCWAMASVNAYAYPKKNSKTKGIKPGVSFGLNHLQLVRDDNPFSGKPKVEDAFQPIESTESAEADSASVFD
jgi:hypothetical protein